MKKIYITFFISLMLLSACSKSYKTPLIPLEASDDVVVTSELVTDFYSLKNKGASSSELGDYISNNIAFLDERDASTLITEIIKSATNDKIKLSGQLYSFPDFTSVYATNFNYVWDINKISTLEDSTLKTFLDELSKSYYKINTHKNYLDVDIDYDRLIKIDNLSDEIRSFISINRNKRSLLMDASIHGEIDYRSLRNNILDLENFIIEYPNTEILYEAETLYKNMISMYFIGSDGLDPFDYENKNFKQAFYDTLIDTSVNYPLTMLSSISIDLLNTLEYKNEYKNIDYVSLVSNFRKMGLKNKNSIVSVISEKSDLSNLVYPQFESFDKKDIQKKMNTKIQSEIDIIKSKLKWHSSDSSKYNISYFVNYGSYKYISIQLTGSSYDREKKENSTVQKNLTFDINTGETIELSELFNTSFDEYNSLISDLIKSSDSIKSSNSSSFDKLKKEPQFMISNQSLVLYFEKGEYDFDDKYPVYVYIKQKELEELLDFRNLYN